MILATYNLWNDPRTLESRLPALCEEIQSVNADVIALQEVPTKALGFPHQPFASALSELCGYSYVRFWQYPDEEDEGLAILSKYPFEEEAAIWDDHPAVYCAVRSTVEVDSVRVAITNVHLDWKCVLTREAQICAVQEWISAQSETGLVEFLCGDFNDVPDSSIHRFLQGRQSLNGHAAKWLDLAEYEQWRSGIKAEATLDFVRNPRWEGLHTLQMPARFDWILLRQDHRLRDREPIINHVRLFGTAPTPIAKKVPSDHYGVCVDVRF